jgi:hypothetical protein
MYGWERQLRLSRAGPALRQAHRRAHSRLVVERCHRALHLLRPRYLPQSPMGQAISYALNQWPTLERFLDHGEVEIDNNLVNAARGINQVMPPPVLCRVAKRWRRISGRFLAFGNIGVRHNHRLSKKASSRSGGR